MYISTQYKNLNEDQLDEKINNINSNLLNLHIFSFNSPINLHDLFGLEVDRQVAENLLTQYNVVDYHTMNATQVYAHIGGWLNDEHLAGNEQYQDSCALRLSIALSSSGVNLRGQAGANNIGQSGNSENIGGNRHVIISARQTAAFLRRHFGAPDYESVEDYRRDGRRDGDIIIFGNEVHVGMATCTDEEMGFFVTGSICVSRESQDD